MQKIGLVPRPALIDPLLRIFERIEDIVEMDEHPHLQRRHDSKENVVDVAAYPAHMGGVDEEDVILFERLENGRIDLLQRTGNDAHAQSVFFADEPVEQIGIGLDESAGDGISEKALVGVQYCARGITRPDLDYAPGAKVPYHAIEDYGIGVGVGIVVEMVAGAPIWPLGKGQFVIITLEHFQKLQLLTDAQIDARDPGRWRREDICVITADLLRIWNR